MNLHELLKLPLVKEFFYTFVLLACLYLLWGKISALEERTDACEQESKTILINTINNCNILIQQNTDAFNEFRRANELRYEKAY